MSTRVHPDCLLDPHPRWQPAAFGGSAMSAPHDGRPPVGAKEFAVLWGPVPDLRPTVRVPVPTRLGGETIQGCGCHPPAPMPVRQPVLTVSPPPPPPAVWGPLAPSPWPAGTARYHRSPFGSVRCSPAGDGACAGPARRALCRGIRLKPRGSRAPGPEQGHPEGPSEGQATRR